MWVILVPFFIQMVVIGIDEVYFHLKRGLPKFERIGHPIDTLSVLACFLFTVMVPFSSLTLKYFIGLGIFSCLLVTKDEFVHKHHCSGGEHWLHALLFLNHPLLLFSLGILWVLMSDSPVPDWMRNFAFYKKQLLFFARCSGVFTFLFFLYQVFFWNILWKKDTPPLK